MIQIIKYISDFKGEINSLVPGKQNKKELKTRTPHWTDAEGGY